MKAAFTMVNKIQAAGYATVPPVRCCMHVCLNPTLSCGCAAHAFHASAHTDTCYHIPVLLLLSQEEKKLQKSLSAGAHTLN